MRHSAGIEAEIPRLRDQEVQYHLGGSSKDLDVTLQKLVGRKAKDAEGVSLMNSKYCAHF